MKTFITLLLILTSCSYNNVCEKEIRLRILNQKIDAQMQLIKIIGQSVDNTDELFIQQMILEDYLIDKAVLQLQNCN